MIISTTGRYKISNTDNYIILFNEKILDYCVYADSENGFAEVCDSDRNGGLLLIPDGIFICGRMLVSYHLKKKMLKGDVRIFKDVK